MKLKEKYGDDLGVLMIEAQGATAEKMEAFAVNQKWVAVGGAWTTERPFEISGSGLPYTVVLGIGGEVLFSSRPTPSTIEDLIAEQLKLAKKGPKDLSPTCAKAWADFEKGNWAAAINALEAVQDGSEKDAAKKLTAALTTRAKAKIARLDGLIESAEFDQADKFAPQLVKGMAGNQTLEPKAKELADKLAAKEMAPEREAAKALDRVEKMIAKNGLDPAARKQLASVGEKYANTRAGKRASHLAKVAEG